MSIKYRGWILLVFLVFVSYILGVVARHGNHPFFYGYLVIVLLVLATYLHSLVYEFFVSFVEKTVATKMLYTGKGFSPRFQISYASILQITSYFIIVMITIGVLHYFAYGYIPFWLPLIAFIMAVLFAGVSILPNLRVSFAISTRKTSTEIELPFLLFYIRVLSSTHLTLYDILRVIEKSSVLKAWANEVKNAFRFASILGTSLITAMNVIAENHPSRVVSDIFKRMLTVAVSLGSIKEIAEKAFGQVYSQLEARLSGLTEKLTIINGLLVFVFLFIPVVFSVIVPLYGGNIVMALIAPLALFSLFFFIVYAVTSNMLPSAFEISTPPLLKILSYISTAVVFTLAVITGFMISIGYGEPNSMVLMNLIIIPLLVVSPVALYSELWLRKARLYDRLIRLSLDASTISTSLGENFMSVLERIAPRYGSDVENLARKIVLSQTSDYLRREIIRDAPSLFHAAFIEVLIHSLSLGAKPEMIKEMASSYEYLVNVNSKLNSISRTQELVIIGLGSMLGWFIGYIRGLLTNYLGVFQQAGVQGAWMPTINLFINFDPKIYDVLHSTAIVSLVFLSAIIGKMRGGSFAFGMRTLLLMLTLFNLGVLMASRFAPTGY